MEVLQHFQNASGQQVNLAKSSIFFSPNTDTNVRREVCSIMGMSEAGDESIYLGLPSTLGRNKSVILGYLKERMRQRIQRWEGKYISKGGKEVLIKSVAQSLPSYAMNVFLLPTEMCKEMEQLMCKYWWSSGSNNSRGIHWKSWKKLTIHKSRGGMGFRNLRDFNLCLLGKQGWRLQSQPDSLVGRIFKARYYRMGDFLTAELGHNPSFVWRSVLEARELVRMGARRRVGNGEDINIINDPWLPCEDNPRVTTAHPSLVEKNVSTLFETGTLAWDKDLVHDVFNNRDAEIILSITLPQSRSKDIWYWSFEKMGHFSVKSAYRYIQMTKEGQASTSVMDFWKRVWKIRVPPKVKHMLWRAATNCLPTKSLLRSRHVNVDEMCPLCNVQRETVIHCLISCSFAQTCWHIILGGIDTSVSGSFAQWLNERLIQGDGESRKLIAVTCWVIWKLRNEVVWNNKGAGINTMVSLVHSTINQWGRAQDRNVNSLAAFMTEKDGAVKWIGPVGGVIKINVDAAIFEDTGRYSYVSVARNSAGVVEEAVTICKEGRKAAEVVEAMGVKEALSWVKRKQWGAVTIETDSLLVVQSIRSKAVMLSYFGDLINDCRVLLEELPNVSLVFVRRSANGVAHFLARASYYVADRIIRRDHISPDFLDVINKDCSNEMISVSVQKMS